MASCLILLAWLFCQDKCWAFLSSDFSIYVFVVLRALYFSVLCFLFVVLCVLYFSVLCFVFVVLCALYFSVLSGQVLGVFGQMAILSSDLEGNKQLAMVVPGQIATSSTILIIVIIIDITFIVVIIITEYHHHHCHRHHHLEFPAVVSLKLVFGNIFCAPTYAS